MPMTLDEIIEQARQLPSEQVLELVDRLTQEFHFEPKVENDWKREIRRRIAEIERGEVTGIPGPEISARIRHIVGR